MIVALRCPVIIGSIAKFFFGSFPNRTWTYHSGHEHLEEITMVKNDLIQLETATCKNATLATLARFKNLLDSFD